MKITLFLIFCCCCLSAECQDFVVTNRGDTLRGELKLMAYDQLDRVQVTAGKDKKMFTALQIREVSYKNETYRPIRRDNTIRFMKLLKAGYLSLYAYRAEGAGYDGRLLSKKDGTVAEVPNLSFKKFLAAYLNDCPSVNKKILDGEFTRKDLNAIIDEYNNCLENKFVSTKVVAPVPTEKTTPLETLKTTVENLDAFDTKADALDVISDMIGKVKSGQAVPHYLVDDISRLLQGNEKTKDALEKALASLK